MFYKFLLCILMFTKECFTNDVNSNVSADMIKMGEQMELGTWVPRVVNGYPAKLGDVPYQIAMKILVSRARNLYMTFCGATLVAPNKMITAAHCFEERGISNCHKLFYPGYNFTIQASSGLLKHRYAVAGNLLNVAKYSASDSDGQWRALNRVIYPKKYVFPKHDIAVAFSKAPFTYNAHVGPIPYAKRHTDYNGKCLVSGYGRTGQAAKDITKILLLANLDIMRNEMCSKGDDGGPLICKNTGDPNESTKGVLVGVVSGHASGKGSFFTRVSKYYGFNELAINSVNETSAVISGPNKEVWFPRVINGIPAKLGDVPYQVSLKKLMKDGFYMTFCGGAIISEKKVLSAAHCFVENVQRNVSLEGFIDNMLLMDKCAVAGCLLNKVNHTNDNDQAQWRKLAGVRYPKNFSFPNYDIAVVYLCTPFIYTDYVAPIPIASKEMDYNGTCLASGYGRTSHTEKDAISNILLLAHLELDKRAACSISQLGDNDIFVCINIQGSDVAKYLHRPFIYTKYVAPIPIPSKDLDHHGNCWVSGYGRTSHTKKDAISYILQLAQMELIKQSTCSKLQLSDNDGFLCTNVHTSDVAKGDSGGPLVCKNIGDRNENNKGVLVGVISGHVTSSYSFFTRVSKYLDFIKDDFVSFVVKKPVKKPPPQYFYEEDDLKFDDKIWVPRVVDGEPAKLGEIPYQ
ncbi:hypothetical protein SFRURICE_015939, partial [Spodoptera frugiperda]